MNTNRSILCAPLQGYTDNIWRNAHYRIFGGFDKYYTPFVRLEHGEIIKRDMRDILPENNSAPIVPQIIACKAEDAQKLVNEIKNLGYDSIDINLGCPFPPIAKHHKGAGLLQYPQEVESLMQSLSEIDGVAYSVKMRLGWDDANQWMDVLPILNDYNVTQVTIHPRIGRQQYKGQLLTDKLSVFLRACRVPVIFNGEICNKAGINSTFDTWPALHGVMIGRGVIANPAIMSDKVLSAENMAMFHNELLEGYAQRLNGGEGQLLRKMQNLWELMLPDADRKAHKLIRKASSMSKYEQAVNQLINTLRT